MMECSGPRKDRRKSLKPVEYPGGATPGGVGRGGGLGGAESCGDWLGNLTVFVGPERVRMLASEPQLEQEGFPRVMRGEQQGRLEARQACSACDEPHGKAGRAWGGARSYLGPE